MRNMIIFSTEIHYNKDLGLIIKLAVTNTSKMMLHNLRLSLFFVKGEVKDPDRPHSIHMLNHDGRLAKDVRVTHTPLAVTQALV